MIDPTGLAGDVVIDGKKYVLDRDTSQDRPGIAFWRERGISLPGVEVGEVVSSVWEGGWHGGMGEAYRKGPDSNGYAWGQNFCCVQSGFARLAPGRNNLTGLSIDDTQTYLFRETSSAIIGSTTYVSNNGNLAKSSTTQLIYRFDGAEADSGSPTLFETKLYVEDTGTANRFFEIATIAKSSWGTVLYFDGAAYTNRTAEANSAAGTAFTIANGNTTILYLGMGGVAATDKFGGAYFDLSVLGIGGTIVWEYWNGSAWTALSPVDDTASFTVDNKVARWAIPADWATNTISGVTNFWARARVSVAFTTIPTAFFVGPVDELTLSDASVDAEAFANIQDGSTAKIARAYSTNFVALAATGPRVSGNYGAGFEVGDSSVRVRAMTEVGSYLMVAKADGIYLFDSTGYAWNLLPWLKGSPDSDDINISSAGERALYSHPSGLYLVDAVNNRISNISIDRILSWSLSAPTSTTPPNGGRHNESALYGSYLWSTYLIPSSEGADAAWTIVGYYPPNGDPNFPIWHTLHFRANFGYRGMLIDESPRAWWVSDENANSIVWCQLDESGSPDSGVVGASTPYGELSTAHLLYLPETPFYRANGEPVPNILKQLESVVVVARGLNATTSPLKLQNHIDGAAVVTIGADVTANGRTSRSPTAGSDDTGYLWMFVQNITTTAGYVNTSTDPRIYSFAAYAKLRPDLMDAYHMIIDTSAKAYSGGGQVVDDAKTQRDNLDTLKGGASITVLTPLGDSISMNIIDVRDMSLDGELSHMLEVIAIERT